MRSSARGLGLIAPYVLSVAGLAPSIIGLDPVTDETDQPVIVANSDYTGPVYTSLASSANLGFRQESALTSSVSVTTDWSDLVRNSTEVAGQSSEDVIWSDDTFTWSKDIYSWDSPETITIDDGGLPVTVVDPDDIEYWS